MLKMSNLFHRSVMHIYIPAAVVNWDLNELSDFFIMNYY